MDWRASNFDWNRARAFLATAEEGSLSAAARALGVAQPTLGRQVSALETELGVALFERVGRGVALTEAGLELVEHVRAMQDAAHRMALSASGRALSIEGNVTISAAESYAVFVLPRLVAQLRRIEPGIVIDIVASNGLSDLRRREADIAIRHVRPSDPELIGRMVGESAGRLYGAHAYLDQNPPIKSASDLAQADFLGFDNDQELMDCFAARGVEISASNIVARSASHLALWEMVKAGVGLGVMDDAIGAKEPLVRQAAPWLETFEFPIWLVSHREVRTSRRIRLVFDFLASELASERRSLSALKERGDALA
ncbi:MAG: LysR family transcriptional regulator [Neomegalonema sp.]|nr:LysR family transcriptional regulator [Neomegalonema sp.]